MALDDLTAIDGMRELVLVQQAGDEDIPAGGNGTVRKSVTASQTGVICNSKPVKEPLLE